MWKLTIFRFLTAANSTRAESHNPIAPFITHIHTVSDILPRSKDGSQKMVLDLKQAAWEQDKKANNFKENH